MNSKKAILLLNLGSPDSVEEADVARYLKQFLMDPYVLDVPYLLRWILVNLIILRTRPKSSAEAYAAVWTTDGSPLVVSSLHLRDLVQKSVSCPVGLGMRYGNPSTYSAIKDLWDISAQQLEQLYVIPLYPQYAESSFKTAVKEAERCAKRICPSVEMTVHPPFYNDPDYVEALVESIAPYFEREYDHIVFSYHGLPERHLRKSDPSGHHCLSAPNCCETAPEGILKTCYKAQCLRTTNAILKQLPVPKDRYTVAFQSRLLKDPWIQPFTDEILDKLAKDGAKKVMVLCPAFVTDCLETLEEIGIRAKEDFAAACGGELTLIPCLNTQDSWVATLQKWSQRFNDL